MKTLIIFFSLLWCTLCTGQSNDAYSTIDFVEILNNNKDEAIYYYENNWKILREKALTKSYISSYKLLEVSHSKEAPFHLMLITSFSDKAQYDACETNFQLLISERGSLNLLNDKPPGEFRRIVFSKDHVIHRN
ncbi:MAG: hypothetical protein HKN09_13605 [Saprospiraceae bacterium]|nr:hypothetical protein [Saprospiraceae bacterium]